MILVTGATGKTGGATIESLIKLGAPVRALVRDPGKFQTPDGVEVAVGHFEDAASLDAALKGVDKAYLVAGGEQQVAQESKFIAAAMRAGLRHLVRLSVMGAEDPDSEVMRFGANHRRMERAVRESGLPWTFLRPTGFMQNYLGQAAGIARQATFYSSLTPVARVAYIDVVDIGAVAAKALTEPGYEGQAYTLTGPDPLNDDEVAARFSAVLGRPIKHVEVPMAATRQSMLSNGVPEWNVDGLVELWTFYGSGGAATVSPDVERLLGRPPRSFNDFVRDHRAMFGG
ncbi:MAG: butenolide phosphate reductase ScbC [Herpetosiphon sp.]